MFNTRGGTTLVWYYFVTNACGTRIRNDWQLYLSLFAIPHDINNHQSISISAFNHCRRHIGSSPSQYNYFAQQMPRITLKIHRFPAQRRPKRLSSSVHSSSLPITTRNTSKLALYRQISRNTRPHIRTLRDCRHIMIIWLAGIVLYRRRDLWYCSLIGWRHARHPLIGCLPEVKKCSGADNFIMSCSLQTTWQTTFCYWRTSFLARKCYCY